MQRQIRPFARLAQLAGQFAGQVHAARFAEAERLDIIVKSLRAKLLADFHRAEVVRLHENIFDAHQIRRFPFFRRTAVGADKAVVVIIAVIRAEDAFFKGRRRLHDFKRRTGFIIPRDRPVFVIFLRIAGKLVRIEIRVIRHRQNFAGVRIHHDDRCVAGAFVAERGLQFPLHHVLNIFVNRQHEVIPGVFQF